MNVAIEADTTTTVMAYCATCRKCGGWVFMQVDDGREREELAKEIAACIVSGHSVERITIERARSTPICDCKPTRIRQQRHLFMRQS